jgi:HAD superfamily hydrolase (TIGR01509 family)
VDENPRNSGKFSGRDLALDIGNVLVDFDFGKIIDEVASQSPRSPEEVTAYFRNTPMADLFERGRISPHELLETAQKDLSFEVEFDRFVGWWNSIFTPHPGMEELAEKLSGRVKLHAASNTNVLHKEYLLQNYPLFDRFDVILASCDCGARKPDPAFFRELLDRIGRPAGEVLFVDDLARNVEGAQRAGMQALRFEGTERLREDLRRMGVLP